MAKFEESLSSQGYFWPQGKPGAKLPGRLFMETFPTIRVYRMSGDSGAITSQRRRFSILSCTKRKVWPEGLMNLCRNICQRFEESIVDEISE